jgi:hypothetical protein
MNTNCQLSDRPFHGIYFAIDSPNTGPNSGDLPTTFKVYSANDEFNMWLMFKPDIGAHSVPLKMVDWKWNGYGVLSGAQWILTSNPNPDSNPVALETLVYPSWTNWIDNFSSHRM